MRPAEHLLGRSNEEEKFYLRIRWKSTLNQISISSRINRRIKDVEETYPDHDGLLLNWDGIRGGGTSIQSAGEQRPLCADFVSLPAFSLPDDGDDGQKSRSAPAFYPGNPPIKAEIPG